MSSENLSLPDITLQTPESGRGCCKLPPLSFSPQYGQSSGIWVPWLWYLTSVVLFLFSKRELIWKYNFFFLAILGSLFGCPQISCISALIKYRLSGYWCWAWVSAEKAPKSNSAGSRLSLFPINTECIQCPLNIRGKHTQGVQTPGFS